MSRQINVVAAEMNNTVERRNAALLHTLLIYVHYPISSVMCIHLCVFFFQLHKLNSHNAVNLKNLQ